MGYLDQRCGMEGLDGISGPNVNTSIFPVGSCSTGCFSFVLIGVSEHSDSVPSFLINATFGPTSPSFRAWVVSLGCTPKTISVYL